eukprot:GHRQ01025899.1.p2 GENE.GHRQ01025899.1~~GHRQ01025899.1.p2  ORF type:complete len:106 (+),score=8.14 GHRQ01025899.1:152-469(+)
MVSVPSKLMRCAQPPSTDCSGLVQPLKPKSCSRLGSSGLPAPPSVLASNAASMMSRARRLRVATVDGYLQGTCRCNKCYKCYEWSLPRARAAEGDHSGRVPAGHV